MIKKLLSIGVDPGSVNGAISVVDEDLKILLLTKAPVYKTEIKSHRNKSKLNKETGKFERDYRKKSWVDFTKLGELFQPYIKGKIIYTVERMSPRPNEGEAPSFTNGNSLGIFQGLYPYLNPIRFYNPLPEAWKKDLGVTSDKETSVELAEELYQIKLRDYLPKGKVDDIAEALLLAFYGLRQYLIKEGEIKCQKC